MRIMRNLFLCLLFSGCAEPVEDTSRPFFGDVTNPDKPKSLLSKTIRTSGGERLKLEDGSELILPSGTFSSAVDVTFSRSRCDGIFASSSFSSCQYSVDFGETPEERFEVNLPGMGVLNAKDSVAAVDGRGYKPVGVLHDGTALNARVFALRSPGDARCSDVQFSACGGDLVGDWVLETACGPREEILNPYSTSNSSSYSACEDNDWLQEYPFTTTRKLMFSAEGQYEIIGGLDVKRRLVITQTCLDIVGESCHESCVLTEGICSCLRTESSGNSARGGSWAYSDGSPTTIVFDGPNPEEGEESGPGEEQEYCVNGDILTVRAKGRNAVFIYQRK